jgi:hypothetical protein
VKDCGQVLVFVPAMELLQAPTRVFDFLTMEPAQQQSPFSFVVEELKGIDHSGDHTEEVCRIRKSRSCKK